MNRQLLVLLQIFAFASALAHASAQSETLAKAVQLGEGKITITTATVKIEIETLNKQLQSIASEAKALEADAPNEGGLTELDDSLQVSEDNVVVYEESPAEAAEGESGPKKVRADDISAEMRDWIVVQAQELSFLLTDLRDQIEENRKDEGEVVARKILFLNTYMELLQISRSRLPMLRWLNVKLLDLDEKVATSLKALNSYVRVAQRKLEEIEARDQEGFSKNKTWYNITYTLKRLKKMQIASRDLDESINAVLQEIIALKPRRDWLRATMMDKVMPQELIYYKAHSDAIAPKSASLEFQYSRINHGY